DLFGQAVKPDEAPGIYYAYGDRALVLSSNLAGLKSGVAREVLANLRRERDPQERANAWLSVNLGNAAELQTYLQTYLERGAHRQALGSAALLEWLHECGAAKDTQRWLGFVPVSPDRSTFRWVAERREVVNDRHGSWREPKLAAEPDAKAPWLEVLADFA